MLKVLEDKVLQLERKFLRTRALNEMTGKTQPSDMAGTKSSAPETPHNMKLLKNMVKLKVEESLEDIIEETAGK